MSETVTPPGAQTGSEENRFLRKYLKASQVLSIFLTSLLRFLVAFPAGFKRTEKPPVMGTGAAAPG
ncbi:hypothetical protein V2S84_15515 [Azotobacter chroococcum]|nr:hypothetical protein [Azotobacter chroococcum]